MYLLSALHSFLYYLHPPSHFLISYLCPLLLMERTYIPRSNKLLHSSPSSSPSVTPTIIPSPMENDNSDTSSSGSFDVIVVLAAMLCALVCALGLNSMLQCVIRCARQMVTEPVEWVQSLRENVGLKKEDVWALPVATYNTSSSPATATAPTSGCAICLVDFSDGDRVRVMPVCDHRFHVTCIDTWLHSHSSCPTCRQRISTHNFRPPVDQPLETVTTH